MTSDIKLELGKRMFRIRSELDLSRPRLAAILGCSQSFISEIEKGRSGPSAKLLVGLESLGFSARWLMSGDGPMRPGAPGALGPLPDVDAAPAALSPLEEAMLLPAKSPETGMLPPDPLPAVIGGSRRIRVLIAEVFTAAIAGRNVLLVGEPGTGKELAAHGIREYGPIRQAPLKILDCATMSSGALDLLSLPEPATILLHRLDSLPQAVTNALIARIKPRGLHLIGSSSVPARMLPAVVRKLFARTIQVPSLRARADDLPLMADYLLRTYVRLHRSPGLEFSPPAYYELMNYPFPGNVRELRFLMRCLVRSEHSSQISLPTWRDTVARSEKQDYYRLDGYGLRDSERVLIRNAFANHRNDLTTTARSVGLDPFFFQFLCFHLGISLPDPLPQEATVGNRP